MNAKAFLKQYQKQKAITANCWSEVARWKDVAVSITSRTDGDRVQSSGSKQRMADAVVSYVDIETEIKQRIAKAHETQREILNAIEQLDEPEYDVLHKVYIQGLSFKEVAASRDKSVSWATSTHGNALVDLQRILDRKNER